MCVKCFCFSNHISIMHVYYVNKNTLLLLLLLQACRVVKPTGVVPSAHTSGHLVGCWGERDASVTATGGFWQRTHVHVTNLSNLKARSMSTG